MLTFFSRGYQYQKRVPAERTSSRNFLEQIERSVSVLSVYFYLFPHCFAYEYKKAWTKALIHNLFCISLVKAFAPRPFSQP